MKKKSIIAGFLAAVLLAMTVILSGCAGANQSKPEDTASKSAAFSTPRERLSLDASDSPEWVTKLDAAKDCDQLIVVAGVGETTCYVSMHEKDSDGNWKMVLQAPGYIGLEGMGKADSYHATTPIGTFTIDKAQSKIEYTIPDDVIFDDKPHGATVTLVEGDGVLTVTYKNTTTGEILTEAPTQVGNYDVIVVVTETDHYYGISQTTIGNFSILSKHTGINEMTVDSEDNGEWYTIDGRRVAAPSKGVIYIHNGKKILVK
jgi:hypothetical protein